MDALRALFSQVPLARARAYTPGRFSFNGKAGRCKTCEGRGSIQVEMHFLSDVWVRCDTCRGKRYNEQTLQVRWKGHSIADVLDLRIDDALGLFTNHRRIARHLKSLSAVGLGYVRLGQPATTLSGGEAQRVKLACELARKPDQAIFVLDEPSTGLHFADVEKLVEVLHKLVDGGATALVIEHHPDIIKNADWVIDMGPEGGLGGGLVIAQGTPLAIAAAGTDTGRAIAGTLGLTFTSAV
jgi:excinuclease ABC subunit A